MSEAHDEWDLEGLSKELSTYWPNEITADKLASFEDADDIYDLVMTDAKAYYEKREAELSPEVMRDVERQVMLRIIDQRWREHLEEMDYLQEGINLRAMGQKDPLTEWQREGYEMFEQLIETVGQEFVKYIMHIQVVVEDPEPQVRNMTESGPEDPSEQAGAGSISRAAAAEAGQAAPEPDPETMQPVVKDSEYDKVGRNDPCPCGSGKKFKLCHGKA